MTGYALSVLAGGLVVYLARWGVSRTMTREERDPVWNAGWNQGWILRGRRNEKKPYHDLSTFGHRPRVLPDDACAGPGARHQADLVLTLPPIPRRHECPRS